MTIAPQKGRKVFTLQTVPPQPEPQSDNSWVAKLNGFSLYAGVAAKAHQRMRQVRLCRYITRPPVAEKRLPLTAKGNVRYDITGEDLQVEQVAELRACGSEDGESEFAIDLGSMIWMQEREK